MLTSSVKEMRSRPIANLYSDIQRSTVSQVELRAFVMMLSSHQVHHPFFPLSGVGNIRMGVSVHDKGTECPIEGEAEGQGDDSKANITATRKSKR